MDSRASNNQVEPEAEQDRELVDRARAGDLQAFRQLVEAHQSKAFALALGLVRNEQDAREIVQEAFLRVHRGLSKFQGGSSFFTWLYRIVTNLSIDHLRRPLHREGALQENMDLGELSELPLVSRVEGADPVDAIFRRELRQRIDAELQRLPPYHRGVIVMREVHGMSYEEMAQAMRVSKGTIMSRLFHARQKLQRALKNYYDEQLGPVRRAGSDGESEPDG